jgi:hypothetical protein
LKLLGLLNTSVTLAASDTINVKNAAPDTMSGGFV